MEVKFLKPVLQKASVALKPVMFTLRKHSPEILMGSGAVAVGVGTVFACKATLSAKDILDEEVQTQIEVEDEETGEVEVHILPESEVKRQTFAKGLKVVKAYLPAGGLIFGGVALMGAAKSIEHRRFITALAAYSTLQSTFEGYRGRVIAEFGPSADIRLLNGYETEKIEVVEEAEEGKKPKKHKEEVVVNTRGEDPFHRIFDACNTNEWVPNRDQNLFYLQCAQNMLNQTLQANGRVFLNDVYKALGFEYNEVGQFVGWLADDIEGSKDGYIDFGIDFSYLREELELAQVENRNPEPSIWLNFNCDGEVWDKPLKKKYDI